jgi:hypothetical protein
VTMALRVVVISPPIIVPVFRLLVLGNRKVEHKHGGGDATGAS